jgi:hypothetical protein
MAKGHAIEHSPLRNVNGHQASVTGSKVAEIRKLEVLLVDKWKRSKSALKDLALAESKRKKLLELLNNRGLAVVQLRTGKTGAVTEVGLLKKLHKTELKSVKELSKKEILTKSVIINKSLKASKKILRQDFDKIKKQYETLGKLQSSLLWRKLVRDPPMLLLLLPSTPKNLL